VIGLQPDCLNEDPQHTRKLDPGDRLLFYTDGLTEAIDVDDRQLRERGLAQIVSDSLSVDFFDMADEVLAHVGEFRFGSPVDDMTLITVEIK